jgi:manganese/iron transport system permease protein/iron/zinc/copper transport system permease protein
VVAFTVGVIFLRYRELLFATFDPEASDAYGVSSRWADSLFAVVLAATVVSTMRILGVMLIAAIIVVPAVIARLLTDSFAKMLVLSTLIGAAAGAAGMYTSYYVNVPPSAAIVLILAGVFVIVYVVTGLTARRRLQVLGGIDRHTDVAGASIEVD